MAVEIIAQGGLTHGGHIYKCGDVEQNPDARLLELAVPGVFILGEQTCRIYDPEQTQTEREEAIRLLRLSNHPTLDQVQESARAYGFQLVPEQSMRELEAEFTRLRDAWRESQSESESLREEIRSMKAIPASHVDSALLDALTAPPEVQDLAEVAGSEPEAAAVVEAEAEPEAEPETVSAGKKRK